MPGNHKYHECINNNCLRKKQHIRSDKIHTHKNCETKMCSCQICSEKIKDNIYKAD